MRYVFRPRYFAFQGTIVKLPMSFLLSGQESNPRRGTEALLEI